MNIFNIHSEIIRDYSDYILSFIDIADEEIRKSFVQCVGFSNNFYEVDYLPENDRIRYTISPEARKEILKRLLDLNHKIHEEEVKEGLWNKKGKKKSKKVTVDENQGGSFGE